MNTLEYAPQQETRLTYEQFQELADWDRMKIIAENRVLNTDTYNRTMDYLRGPEGWKEEETYTLQMRKSPYGYLVAAGIEDAIGELTSKPITQEELDFAEACYNNLQTPAPAFNKEMWQTIIDDYDGYLPIEANGVPDGTVVLPGEPLLRVTGPSELIAHFEHLFHRPFYSTLVATKAHEITRLLGDPDRFIEVGKRAAPAELTHLQALKAIQIGGGINQTSNDAGAAIFENMEAVGTIGHRYVQRFESVEAAFRHAIENLDAVSLLVDLTDSYEGMEIALRLKEEYRDTGKKIWIRLDGGDLKNQVRFYLDECAKRGFTDPVLDRLTVEGYEDIAEMADIESIVSEEEKARVKYGAGGMAIAANTARSDASTGFKLSEYEGFEGELEPTMKFSDSRTKRSIPGKPTIAIQDGQRYVAQVNELQPAEDLLTPLYRDGRNAYRTLPTDAYQRCQEQFQALQPYIENGKIELMFSPETAKKIGKVLCKYGMED